MPGHKNMIRQDFRLLSLFFTVILLVIAGIEAADRGYPEYYTPPQPVDGDGDGNDTTPEPVEIEALAVAGYTSEGASSEEAFSLEYESVLGLYVQLTWQDDIGNNDEFGITVLQEGEEVGSHQSNAGHVGIDLWDDRGGYEGNYTVIIEALDCPGIVGPMPIDRDSGNDWELTVTATVIEGGSE